MRRTAWIITAALAAALTVAPAHAAEESPTAPACATPPPGPSQGALALEETVAGASPGFADTRIRWTRWQRRITSGDTTVLAGQVVTDRGSVPAASVDLYAREVGTTGWDLVTSTTSDPDTGVFEFGCLHPDPTTDFRVVHQGDIYYRESSGTRRVRVARAVPDSMRQVAPDTFRYAGTVRPRYRRSPVLLQARDCPTCSWRRVDRDTSNRRSLWSFRIGTAGFSGRRWFRAVVPASDGYARSRSEHVWRISSR